MPPPSPSQLAHGPWYVAKEPRPGVVVAGAVIAFVLIGLTIALLLIGVIGVVAVHADSDPEDHLSSGATAVSLVVLGLAIALCVAAIVFGGLALARRQWARVVTIVLGFASAVLVAFVGICLIVDDDAVGEVVTGVVVVFLGLAAALSAVLLLLPPAGRWYRSRPAAR